MNESSWWRSAVVYQIYPRSFADGNADGTGDLAGVRSRLGYLAALGIDAIWFTPWYVSPLADGGYDVADYRQIDPRFGTLEEAEALIREAADLGIRTIIDIVPNHISAAPPWFTSALSAQPGSAEREHFVFHPGKGEQGEIIPTGWLSSFQGTTWTRTTADGTPGQWYLHLFTPEQPDLNWINDEVRREHEDILRFWFDRGVAGFRIDSAALLIKDLTFPEVPADESTISPGQHPFVDRDAIHDIYKSWRRVADSYTPPRVLVGEVWLENTNRFAAYLAPDEMHTAFNFDFMTRPWDAAAMRQSINMTLAAHVSVGAPPTWVLSNHDITRPVTRYGREHTSFAFSAKRFGTPTDVDLGSQRARAASLLVAALPGSLYIYQGDELGLPEADIAIDAIDDPMYFRSGGVDPGRDGCRVPLPWTTNPHTNFGFSTVSDQSAQATPSWLPQPRDWGSHSVAIEEADPDSMLALYRRTLAMRHEIPDFMTGDFEWVNTDEGSLTFRRGCVVCCVNFGPTTLPLPEGELVIASSACANGVGPDTAVWVRTKGV